MHIRTIGQLTTTIARTSDSSDAGQQLLNSLNNNVMDPLIGFALGLLNNIITPLIAFALLIYCLIQVGAIALAWKKHEDFSDKVWPLTVAAIVMVVLMVYGIFAAEWLGFFR